MTNGAPAKNGAPLIMGQGTNGCAFTIYHRVTADLPLRYQGIYRPKLVCQGKSKTCPDSELMGVYLCALASNIQHPLLHPTAKAGALFLYAAAYIDAVALRSEIWLSPKFQINGGRL